MALTAEQKYLLNKMNDTARKVQLGTLLEQAANVLAADIALANGKVFVGGVSGVAAEQTLSGDVTVSNAGVTAIGSAKVLLAMLGAGITFTHRVYAAGKFTTLGGDASETITVSGAVATDIIHVFVQTAGGTPRSIVSAVPGTGNVVVTLSGDPSTDHILGWTALRATT